MNVISYLKQPFPKAENKWKDIVIISLFVPFFLFVFQPFGIGSIENSSDKYLFIGGFFAVTFTVLVLCLIVFERIFYRFFEEKNWCLYKELLWLIIIILSIGFGNVLYETWFYGNELTLSLIANFQLITFAVALFPITIFIITKQNYLFKKYSNSANRINNNLLTVVSVADIHKTIALYSYNEKIKSEFYINNLLFIESQGNHIKITYSEKNTIKCKSIRNTLKRTLDYLVDVPELVQCHRAFIVNLSKVIKVEGNSQGLVLKFENCDTKIPVSRSFVSTIKNKLSEKS